MSSPSASLSIINLFKEFPFCVTDYLGDKSSLSFLSLTKAFKQYYYSHYKCKKFYSFKQCNSIPKQVYKLKCSFLDIP